ncbi:YggN family protein [Xanthomonas campestris]|uniref:YggN family protein n=1 Tax=Xanthomonas campestris pv. papavericola TaxID=487881 RepID=A0AAJ2X344_XANCA|nr:YggN family protein [Xanthomonas campestris]MEC3888217.1 YggN family protein [Xanthomonas campestris pv. papavericola]
MAITYRTTFAIALGACLAAGSGVASADELHCEVNTDYDLTLNPRSLILIRDSGTPQRLVMRQGALFVDDRWVTLSDDDRTRLVQFEQQTRAVLPLAQEVGREAPDIAITALGEVAAGFSRDPSATRTQLASVRDKVDLRLKQSFGKSQLTPVDIDDEIGTLVAEMLPQLIGDVVASTVQAAMTGNGTQLRSLDGLEQRIERLVEPQARALRPRAQQLCTRMEALDALDNALAYRLPSGVPLQLLQVDRRPAK